MLLKSISLHNFRQFVDEKIDFSTDANRNVTLVIGENGTGKTSFAQAFFWCLYGETSFSDKILLNRSICERMTPDQKKTVKVVLKLIHGSADYEITRTQEYKKTYSNKIVGANTVLNISVKPANGNTRYLKPLECETEIKKILPKELSNYFFFDGERIEKMSKEIASGKKSSSFASAVVGLTGLNATLAALDHLSPTKLSSSVIGKFNDAYVGDSSGKIKKLTQEIDGLQSALDATEKRLIEIEDEINLAETSKRKLEDDIKQYEDGARLQADREELSNQLKVAEQMKSMFIKTICSDFNNGMMAFFAISMVHRALEIVGKSDFGGKDIPEMHSKTINFLLNRGTCLCGTQLMEGSLPYKNLHALLEYLPPQAIGVTVGSFVKESRAMYQNDRRLFEKIGEALATVSQQDESISNLNEQIGLISSKLDGENVLEQVRLINSQIKKCNDIIENDEKEKQEKLKSIGGLETQKKLKENSRSELSLMDKSNQQIEMCKAYALRIYEELREEYKHREAEIRVKLETSMNHLFQTIYAGGLSLSIDEKYNISVYVNDFDGGVETSTAQSISVIFAFISAIIKMARDNQKENSDVSYSEPYPLVMDAPLSAFDKRRIKAICEAIPETAEQVIIFIKDTDGDLAEKYLGAKIKTRHRFVKLDEFNTQLS